MGSEQDVSLEALLHTLDDPKKMLEDVIGIGHYGGGSPRVKLTDAPKVPSLMVIIEQVLKEVNA